MSVPMRQLSIQFRLAFTQSLLIHLFWTINAIEWVYMVGTPLFFLMINAFEWVYMVGTPLFFFGMDPHYKWLNLLL